MYSQKINDGAGQKREPAVHRDRHQGAHLLLGLRVPSATCTQATFVSLGKGLSDLNPHFSCLENALEALTREAPRERRPGRADLAYPIAASLPFLWGLFEGLHSHVLPELSPPNHQTQSHIKYTLFTDVWELNPTAFDWLK